jgi:hypothetical protein
MGYCTFIDICTQVTSNVCVGGGGYGIGGSSGGICVGGGHSSEMINCIRQWYYV